VLAVVDPGAVELFLLAVDQVVEHCQHLPLHGGKGLGGFNLDQVLVEGGHQARQREHEIGERRGHVADETGCSGMDRLGDQVLLDELGVVGDVGRLLRNGGGAEMGLYLFHASFDGDNVGLEEAGDIGGDRPVDDAEGRIGGFRHGEDPVEVFQIGTGGFATFRHYCFTLLLLKW